MKPHWAGVFPAITTRMHRDGSIDLDATARHAELLIESGVCGMVFLGSLGENQPMTGEEKRLVIKTMVKAVRGRIPVLSDVAVTSAAEAVRDVRDVNKLGGYGEMLMPGMLYRAAPEETMVFVRTVAKGTGLQIIRDGIATCPRLPPIKPEAR